MMDRVGLTIQRIERFEVRHLLGVSTTLQTGHIESHDDKRVKFEVFRDGQIAVLKPSTVTLISTCSGKSAGVNSNKVSTASVNT